MEACGVLGNGSSRITAEVYNVVELQGLDGSVRHLGAKACGCYLVIFFLLCFPTSTDQIIERYLCCISKSIFNIHMY